MNYPDIDIRENSPQSCHLSWLALMIGNSRLHWAWFMEKKLCCAWDTDYLPATVVEQMKQPWGSGEWNRQFLPPSLIGLEVIQEIGNSFQYRDRPLPLYLASVVPSETALWQTYPDVHVITLDQVQLQGVYPTLGIDRALALWGAGETWGWPVLVIDAGTALTLTGADPNRCLVGGAILPGVSLQLESLSQKTANLPLIDANDVIPSRWAMNTPEAIQSGVIYTIIAGIRDFVEDWWQKFPDSSITLTGGDRTLLLTYLKAQFPDIAARVILDPHLIFWGMRSCCRN